MSKSPTFSAYVKAFNKGLSDGLSIPAGFEVLNPFQNPQSVEVSEQFYDRFYDDCSPRIFIYGINPGRFGAGITAVPFTDPVNLEQFCCIANGFQKKHELSSKFIYQMIEAYGGVEKFYQSFFITAVSPLGFVKDGKNINYYDDHSLEVSVTPFIEKSISSQLIFPTTSKVCICLGEGKNYKFLVKLNRKLKIYDQILPLAHPRYILQYKRKQLDHYISHYLTTMDKALELLNL